MVGNGEKSVSIEPEQQAYIAQLEAEVRSLKTDIDLPKRGHTETVNSLNWKISRLQTKVHKLSEAPLPFDKEPYRVDGKH